MGGVYSVCKILKILAQSPLFKTFRKKEKKEKPEKRNKRKKDCSISLSMVVCQGFAGENYARRASFCPSKRRSRLTLSGRRRQAIFAGVFCFVGWLYGIYITPTDLFYERKCIKIEPPTQKFHTFVPLRLYRADILLKAFWITTSEQRASQHSGHLLLWRRWIRIVLWFVVSPEGVWSILRLFGNDVITNYIWNTFLELFLL